MVDCIALYDENCTCIFDQHIEDEDWHPAANLSAKSPLDVLHEAHASPSDSVKQETVDTWALAAEIASERGAEDAIKLKKMLKEATDRINEQPTPVSTNQPSNSPR